MPLPGCFKETEQRPSAEREVTGGGCWAQGCKVQKFHLGFSICLRSDHSSGLISSYSFTTNKSSKVTGFQTPQINFIFLLSADCSVRQLEEKLILGVSVSPVDSRSRLRDKLLITVQGARAGRREQCSPW